MLCLRHFQFITYLIFRMCQILYNNGSSNHTLFLIFAVYMIRITWFILTTHELFIRFFYVCL